MFHPFDVAPPEPDVCLDRLYDLFADYPISWGWCLQCFGVEWEERMRAHPDIRTAPRDAFNMIYFEHPNCSGGETTFLHWLPRGLELSCLDSRLDPNSTHRILQLGLLAWPAERLQALRDLFCRIAINWFVHGHVSPLQRPSCNSVWNLKGRVGGSDFAAIPAPPNA